MSGRDAEFERLRHRLRLALGALGLVILLGVLGFLLIGGGRHGLVDAVYMTIITLSTVGFGEVIDMSHNPAGRVFTVALILGGMGIVAYTVPMMAAFMLEGQLHHIFARRRMQKTIEKLADHFIICGDTAASWYVVQELVQTARPAVVVAPTPEALERAAERLGEAPAIAGDPTADDVLVQAGVTRAAGVVFAMESDKDNVLGVLTARRLAPGVRIVAATERPETEAKLRVAGADAVVSPSRIGGLRMASELVRPRVVSFLDQMLRQDGGSLRVEEVTVPDGAVTEGMTLGSLEMERLAGAVLLAVRRAGRPDFDFKPVPETPLERGMTLVIMADAQGRQRLEARLRR